jgi:hypothetical protein
MVPLCIFILLIIAFGLRWDKGPTLSFNGSLKLQYFKDRWTGQSWLKLYGSLPEKDYESDSEKWVMILNKTKINTDARQSFSGELYPNFSIVKINKKSEEILSGPIGIEKIKPLQDQIDQAQKQKSLNAAGHTRYLQLEEYINLFIPKYIVGESGWRNIPNPEYYKAIASKIPQATVNACNSWRNANIKIKETQVEIKKLSAWSITEAKRELTKEAHEKRNIATVIWCFIEVLLLIASAIIAFPQLHNNIIKFKESQIPD